MHHMSYALIYVLMECDCKLCSRKQFTRIYIRGLKWQCETIRNDERQLLLMLVVLLVRLLGCFGFICRLIYIYIYTRSTIVRSGLWLRLFL